MASSSKPSKAAANAARERAIQLKAKERRTQRRNYVLAVAGVLAAILLIVWLVMIIVAKEGVPDSGKLNMPSAADESGGILLNQDGTLGGTPPEGAVRVDIYLDLMCPICHEFETRTGEGMRSLREDGTVAVYYHPVAILDGYSRGSHYSTRAASALVTVAEYDPAHFEAFFAALFENQPKEQSSGLNNAGIADVARGAGVSDDAIAKFADGDFTQWVYAASDRASKDGLRGTPWIRVEQQVDFGSDVWGKPENMMFTLSFIHENGLQAYLDAVAATQADPANPSPTATP